VINSRLWSCGSDARGWRASAKQARARVIGQEGKGNPREKRDGAMNQRYFVRSAGVISATLAFPKTARLLAEGTTSSDWRTFEVTTQVEVLKPSGTTRIWVPTALGKVRIELCAKSFILQAYDVLARHTQLPNDTFPPTRSPCAHERASSNAADHLDTNHGQLEDCFIAIHQDVSIRHTEWNLVFPGAFC
jgi:hypothetical protein